MYNLFSGHNPVMPYMCDLCGAGFRFATKTIVEASTNSGIISGLKTILKLNMIEGGLWKKN